MLSRLVRYQMENLLDEALKCEKFAVLCFRVTPDGKLLGQFRFHDLPDGDIDAVEEQVTVALAEHRAVIEARKAIVQNMQPPASAASSLMEKSS